MFCAAGLPGMSQSIWRHCLNRRSHTAWHNSSAGLQVSLTKSEHEQHYSSLESAAHPQQDLYIFWKCFWALIILDWLLIISARRLTVCVQVTLPSPRGESCAPSGFMTPGHADPTVTLEKAAQHRTWTTWWSPCLQRNHNHKYLHVQTHTQTCALSMYTSSHIIKGLALITLT